MSWEPKTLDELGYVSRGRSRHRPRDAAYLYGGPHPFVQTGDVKHAGLYLTEYSQTYSDAGLAQSRMWPEGTLCITIAANIADTAILGIDACFPDSVIGFIPEKGSADARFIKYMFDALLKRQFRQFTQGAAQDNLSQAKLLSLTFPIPPIAEQTRIASILSAYDDLIENNRRRIQLLEESARLLYREWFVHLRFPGHENTKIADGVPEGWDRLPLSAMCGIAKLAVQPTTISPETPYIGLEHMPRRSITLDSWGQASDVESMKYRFAAGDILFGKIRPYFHKVGFALVDGITSSDAIVICPKDYSMHHYVLCLVSSDSFVALTSQTVREGSKMPRADWKYMMISKFLVPPKTLLGLFRDVIEPVCGQLKILAMENKSLAATRDLLLPRLMNGEIKV